MTFHIETERLLLRPLGPEDAAAHMALMADPAVAAFLAPDGKVQSSNYRWRQFASYLGHWRIRGYGFFAVEEKRTGAFVGRVGPWRPEGWPGLECGWAISSAHWGKGYAAEASIATIRWTFLEFADVDRVVSLIDPGNRQSEAVAVKVGQQKTGEIFEFWDVALYVWTADRDAWLDRFGAPGDA